MRLKKYYVFCASCVVAYILSAFAWEHFLAILITSLFWVSTQYFSNKQFIKKLELANDKNINLAKQVEAGDIIRKRLTEEYLNLINTNNKNLAELVLIKEELNNYLFSTTEDVARPYEENIALNVPQSEASKKIGACVHSRTTLTEGVKRC